MRINWKVRFKNKAWLLTFLVTVVAFLYQVLGMFGVTVPVSEDEAVQVIGIVMNLFAALGVIVDPTTKGASDSARALTYEEPN